MTISSTVSKSARSSLFAVIALCWLLVTPTIVRSQGIPMDSLAERFDEAFHGKPAFAELQKLIPNYESQRVWGFAIGDFTNDSLPDLAISVYDLTGRPNQVRLYLFVNIGQHLQQVLTRSISYVESPIEVGLLIDGSVVTVVQKLGEQHWYQEGYTIEFGDIILVDRYETTREDLAGKARTLGHDVYRNFELLNTRESYFSGSTDTTVLSAKYVTFPAYSRYRQVYPGYGYSYSDTSKQFILSGEQHRRNLHDLSIDRALAAYEQDYIYFSISVNDETVVRKPENGAATNSDRVSLWFDTKVEGDHRIASKKGSFPMFRTERDSLIYGLTFPIPQESGTLKNVILSYPRTLNVIEQKGFDDIKARWVMDTTVSGLVKGYTVMVRVPITFFGFEMNPVTLFERNSLVLPMAPADTAFERQTDESEDAAALGFTAVVYDVDDAAKPQEATVEATSLFDESDPTTYGTMLLYPNSRFYGKVFSPYLPLLTRQLLDAGY